MKAGQRILYMRPDGTLLVAKYLSGDPEAFMRKVEAANPGIVWLGEIADRDRPDRRWRQCWQPDGIGHVVVNMALARQQRLAEVRAVRDARLAIADGPTLREQEKRDQGKDNAWKAWADYKQALRDLPEVAGAEIEALSTPDELHAYEPAWPAAP